MKRLAAKEQQGNFFGGDENVLFPNCGDDHRTVYICQNSIVHLKLVNFTVCKLPQ